MDNTSEMNRNDTNEVKMAFEAGFKMGSQFLDYANAHNDTMEKEEPKEGELVDPYLRARKAALEDIIAETNEALELESENAKDCDLSSKVLEECKEAMASAIQNGEKEPQNEPLLLLALAMLE